MRIRLIKILTGLAAALAALMLPTAATAQTDPQFSQYYEVPTFYNPAAVGLSDFVTIRGGTRMQWVGIDNAPQSFVATADMPLKLFNKRFGLGVVFNQKSEGLYKSLDMGAQIGYKFKKFGGEFTAALQIGFYDQAFKGSKVFIPDDDDYHEGNDDGIPTQDIHGTALDLGIGLWYKHKYFDAGLSSTHLTSPTITMNAENSSSETERNYEFEARRTLYFIARGNIPLKNTLFEILPSVMVKSDFTFTTGEITARARYNKFLSFGIGYRWKDAVVATVAAEFKNFFLGYSYDYATSAIAKASSGSHEVFAGYRLKLDLSDKNRNKQKNIRIM